MRTIEALRGRTALATAVTLTLGLGLAGCQQSKLGEPARVGDYIVSARAFPDPPTTGDNRLVLELKDAQGVPVEGANLDFLVSMPAMGAMPPMRNGGQVRARGRGSPQPRWC